MRASEPEKCAPLAHRPRRGRGTIHLGLDGFDGPRSQTLTGMLASPARKAPDNATE